MRYDVFISARRYAIGIFLLINFYPAVAESTFYNGYDLKQLCTGFESGFKMANFRFFKCEAYLMGSIDQVRHADEDIDLPACLRDAKGIETLATSIMTYLNDKPAELEKPAPEVVNHVMATLISCK